MLLHISVSHFESGALSRHLINCLQMKNPAGPVESLDLRGTVIVRDFQTVLHQETAAETPALEAQGLFVNAVHFVHPVHPVRVKSGHPDAREMLIVHLLGFPPEEDRLSLVCRTVHQ